MLSSIKVGLSRLKDLLRIQHAHLLVPIHGSLRSLEVLPSQLKGLGGFNALVAERHLLSALELSLRSLEGALRSCLLRLVRLRPQALAGLELALRCALTCSERLLAGLHRELVLLGGIELPGSVVRALVGQRLVGVGLCVGLGDRRGLVDHRGRRSADGHGAVDEATLIHLLQRHRAGALHQRVVFGQQRFDLTSRRLGGPVHLTQLRVVRGRLRHALALRGCGRRCLRLHVKRVVGNHCGHDQSSNDKGPHMRAPVGQTRDGVGRRRL